MRVKRAPLGLAAWASASWLLGLLAGAGTMSTCLAEAAESPFVAAIEKARPWLVKIQAGGSETPARRAQAVPWQELRAILPSVALHGKEVVSGEAKGVLAAWSALQRPVSCEFVESPVRDILTAIAEGCGLSLCLKPGVGEPVVTVACQGVPAHHALSTVCRLSQRDFRLRGRTIVAGEDMELGRDEIYADVESCEAAARVAAALDKKHQIELHDAPPAAAFAELEAKLGVAVTLTPSAKASRNRVSLQADAMAGRQLLRMVLESLGLQIALHKGGILVFDPAADGRPAASPGAAHGTGIIFDSAGYIATTARTLQHQRTALVLLPDGARAQAVVIGTAEADDVAVLKVDRDDLPVASFGDSDALRVGEFVAALAYPFDSPRPTASLGIVSATDRRINRVYRSVLVTDAAIFPGSAGGALLNAEGHVVGMIAAVYSAAQGSRGLGCCIPANTLIKIAEALKYRLPVRENWVGLTVRDVKSQDAGKLKLPSAKGAVVLSVGPQSPAQKAGLIPNDVIVACDRQPIVDVDALASVVEKAEPGSVLSLSFLRGGELRSGKLVVDAKDAGR